MKAATNQKLARMLRDIADALEISGDNPFKIRAYRSAAQSLDNLPRPAMEIHAEGGVEALTAIPGIGKSIAAKIEEVLQTGALGKLEEVSEEVPPELGSC